MTDSISTAARALAGARSAVVMGHTRPDGDSVGSVLALVAALRSLGCDATPVLVDEGPGPELYSFLVGFDAYRHLDELSGSPEVVVAVDTPNPKRLVAGSQLLEAAQTVVVIDHHPDAIEYGDVNVLDSETAAVGQLVWRIIEKMGAVRTPEIATSCFTALMTDTGRFQFQNTSAQVMRDAAEMIDAGADPSQIASSVYQSRTYASFALRARVMERLTVANHGHVVYSWIEPDDMRETQATLDDLEGMPDLVRTMREIEVAVVLKSDEDGCVRANLRSKGSFDVGSVARGFGGGGHAAAAGFTAEGTRESVLVTLLSQLPGAVS